MSSEVPILDWGPHQQRAWRVEPKGFTVDDVTQEMPADMVEGRWEGEFASRTRWLPAYPQWSMTAESSILPSSRLTSSELGGGGFMIQRSVRSRTILTAFVVQGRLGVHRAGHRATLYAGEGLVLAPGASVFFDPSDGAGLIDVETAFDPSRMPLGNRDRPASLLTSQALTPPVSAFIERALLRQRVPADDLATDALVNNMMRHLHQTADELYLEAADPLLVDALFLVNERASRVGWGLEQLAASLRVSRRTIQRRFAAAGLTVNAEILRRRNELARQLITHPVLGQLTIEEIAERSGHGTGQALRRGFRVAGLPSPRQLISTSRDA